MDCVVDGAGGADGTDRADADVGCCTTGLRSVGACCVCSDVARKESGASSMIFETALYANSRVTVPRTSIVLRFETKSRHLVLNSSGIVSMTASSWVSVWGSNPGASVTGGGSGDETDTGWDDNDGERGAVTSGWDHGFRRLVALRRSGCNGAGRFAEAGNGGGCAAVGCGAGGCGFAADFV